MRDLVIIGAGPGGFDTAIYAKKLGLDVVLLEKETVGGTCLNWGCIPTKALYHHAKHVLELNDIATFGIDIPNVTIDFETIKQRKETIVSNQINHIKTHLNQLDIPLIKGTASIVDEHTVSINKQTISTKHIIIATGSSVKKISFEGDHYPIINTSKEMLEFNRIPNNLVVVGGGVIGIEMASIYHAFGSNVTIVEYENNVLPSLDSHISKRAKSLLKRKGITVYTKASLKHVTQTTESYKAIIQRRNKEITLDTDCVLIATGRKPNFGNLTLDDLGIKYTKKGITVNENKQTSLPSIYAIGDVNGEYMLAHKATYDGYHVVNHILNNDSNIRFDLVPSVVFSFPEIATVGKREEDIDKDYRVSKFLFKTNAKAECMNETDGFIKLIASEDGTLIGAHIIGTHASDLIHELTSVMNKNIKIAEYKSIIHAHPTISEVIGECIKEF